MTIKFLYDYIDPHKGIIPNLEPIFGNFKGLGIFDHIKDKTFLPSYIGAEEENWFYPINVKRFLHHIDDLIIKPDTYDNYTHFYHRISDKIKEGLEKKRGYILFDFQEPATVEYINALCYKIKKGSEITSKGNIIPYDRFLFNGFNKVNNNKNFLNLPYIHRDIKIEFENKIKKDFPYKDFCFLCANSYKNKYREIIIKSFQKMNIIEKGYVSGFLKDPARKIDNVVDFLPIEVLEKSYINVVPEMFYKIENSITELGSDILISEKTYRNFLWKKPFLLFAQPHTLKFIKNQGYKTFDRLFDESYDEVSDINKRFSLVCKQIDWWCSLEKKEKLNYLESINDILDYNYTLYTKIISSSYLENELNRYFKNG